MHINPKINFNSEDIKEINRIAKLAAEAIRKNPNTKIFIPMRDSSNNWLIWDAVAKIWYSVEEFESRFGYAPHLPQTPVMGEMVTRKKLKRNEKRKPHQGKK